MKLTRFILAGLLAAAVSLILTACDVHEFPSEDLEHEVVLELDFDKALPIYKIVEVESRSDTKSWTNASDKPEDYDLRHIIQIYRADRNGDFNRDIYKRITVFRDEVGIEHDRIELSLPAGTYRFIVWTDNVPTEGGDDFFYNTSQFEEIFLIGNHAGCNDMRDSFKGTTDYSIRSGVTTVIPVSMERPLAKFTFISTDFDEFRTKVLTMLAVKAEAEKREAEARGLEAADDDPVDTKALRLNDFKVVFKYTGFMPSSYNLYTMKPADAKTGVSFETRMIQIDETSAELGFDYVFINGNEGSVSVSIVTYDMDGIKMSESRPFEVPLKRSQHTIVKGKFLTTMSSGSVGIDPGFDGEFNVVIP